MGIPIAQFYVIPFMIKKLSKKNYASVIGSHDSCYLVRLFKRKLPEVRDKRANFTCHSLHVEISIQILTLQVEISV